MHAVLDAGVVAHVGVVTPEGPVVIPMGYGRGDAVVYVHGAVGNAALRAAAGEQVCVTVTVLDGLIVGRSPFHNSMRYRSAVVRGEARRATDAARAHGGAAPHQRSRDLDVEHARAPTDAEIRKTMVLAVPLAEASVKVRAGGPVDEPEDLDGPHWGGAVPLISSWGDPEPADDLVPGIVAPPSSVTDIAGTRAT
ncbi:MAG: pyridoxamine 5'-phosphate oxidase family protein [Ilumatobacteraceae bacterium]